MLEIHVIFHIAALCGFLWLLYSLERSRYSQQFYRRLLYHAGFSVASPSMKITYLSSLIHDLNNLTELDIELDDWVKKNRLLVKVNGDLFSDFLQGHRGRSTLKYIPKERSGVLIWLLPKASNEELKVFSKMLQPHRMKNLRIILSNSIYS